MARIKIKIPSRLIMARPDSGTVATRGRGGRFTGRRGPDSKNSYSGRGDTTRARHLTKSIDLNHNGTIDPQERGGTIHGRTVKVRATPRARGYERRV